jgi:hypothetical protein
MYRKIRDRFSSDILLASIARYLGVQKQVYNEVRVYSNCLGETSATKQLTIPLVLALGDLCTTSVAQINSNLSLSNGQSKT